MRKPSLKWRERNEWFHFDEHLNPVVNDDAPSEAKESYRHYLEQQRNESHIFLPPCDLSSCFKKGVN